MTLAKEVVCGIYLFHHVFLFIDTNLEEEV